MTTEQTTLETLQRHTREVFEKATPESLEFLWSFTHFLEEHPQMSPQELVALLRED